MKKILILSLALGLSYCEKAPEAPKAEAKAAVEAPKVEGTPVGLDLTKSTVKWIGTKLKGKHNGTVKIADGNILVKDNKVVGGKFSLDMTSIDNLDMKDDAKMKAKLEGKKKQSDENGDTVTQRTKMKQKKLLLRGAGSCGRSCRNNGRFAHVIRRRWFRSRCCSGG
jgi:hypothetical protein